MLRISFYPFPRVYSECEGFGDCRGIMRLTPLGQKGLSSTGARECNLLEICDTQLLLECPIDLSALSLFLPILLPTIKETKKRTGPTSNAENKKQKKDNLSTKQLRCTSNISHPFKEVHGEILIDAEPWYKTADLGLLDVALIDAVVISNPVSMLGLPFLTRKPEFTAKIFATVATTTVGKLMMQELVTFHSEYVKLYGRPSASERYPPWTHYDVTGELPQNLKDYLVGEYGSDVANWHQLYSAEDISNCIKRVHQLRYGEEASVDGCVTLTAYGSGLCIGSSNWVIRGPWSSLTYISRSVITPKHASTLNVSALEGGRVLLLSDLQSCEHKESGSDVQLTSTTSNPISSTRPWATAFVKFITPQNRPQICNDIQSQQADSDQKNCIPLMCKAAVDAISKGGCVLFPVNVSDEVLVILETISTQLASANLGHIPIFYISPNAEEFLAFTNTVPEWLSPVRQEKLYAGEALFGHVELLKEKRLHHLPSVSASRMLELWQEPCVVFAAHASLRMGPAVHLLHRWRQRPECLLILTQPDHDTELTLCPFKPLALQVLHFPSATGLRSTEVASILQLLRPTIALVPQVLKTTLKCSGETQALFYSHREPVEVPELEGGLNMDLSAELASRIKPKQINTGNAAIARLSAEMHFHDGHFYLELPSVSRMTSVKQRFCGTLDVDSLVRALRDKGLSEINVADNGSGESKATVISLSFPSNASIELTTNGTCIKTDDPVLRRLVADAVTSALQAL